MEDHEWIRVGAKVVKWRGGTPLPYKVFTIDRLTKTQIVLNDGTRWFRDRLRQVGDHGYNIPFLYHVDDPRLKLKEREQANMIKRRKIYIELSALVSYWVSHPKDETTRTELREVLAELTEQLNVKIEN